MSAPPSATPAEQLQRVQEELVWCAQVLVRLLPEVAGPHRRVANAFASSALVLAEGVRWLVDQMPGRGDSGTPT